jgi:hypothetical protein
MGEGDPKPRPHRSRDALYGRKPETRPRYAEPNGAVSARERHERKAGSHSRLPDQEPPKPPRRVRSAGTGSGKTKEGYVRLQIRVEHEDSLLWERSSWRGHLLKRMRYIQDWSMRWRLGREVSRPARSPMEACGARFRIPRAAWLMGHHITEVPSYDIAVRISD